MRTGSGLGEVRDRGRIATGNECGADSVQLTVSTRALGRRRPLLADFSITPPDGFGDGEDTRLRDLITLVVRQEVERFSERQNARRFDRVLSTREITESAARGKVDPAAKSFQEHVGAEDAVAAALLAFEDGLYLVIVDEVERKDLDETVRLTQGSRITFVRLTFLAGA